MSITGLFCFFALGSLFFKAGNQKPAQGQDLADQDGQEACPVSRRTIMAGIGDLPAVDDGANGPLDTEGGHKNHHVDAGGDPAGKMFGKPQGQGGVGEDACGAEKTEKN